MNEYDENEYLEREWRELLEYWNKNSKTDTGRELEKLLKEIELMTRPKSKKYPKKKKSSHTIIRLIELPSRILISSFASLSARMFRIQSRNTRIFFGIILSRRINQK